MRSYATATRSAAKSSSSSATAISCLVLTSVKIEVSLLGITIYRFVHRSEEEWKGGELARLTSNTDDDGDRRVVDLKLVDGMLKGQL